MRVSRSRVCFARVLQSTAARTNSTNAEKMFITTISIVYYYSYSIALVFYIISIIHY